MSEDRVSSAAPSPMSVDAVGGEELPTHALVSWCGGRRRCFRAPVMPNVPCISGEADPALGKYAEKLACLERRREVQWPPHDGWSLYHAAALTIGALRGRDYNLDQCSEAASGWVRAAATSVSALLAAEGAGGCVARGAAIDVDGDWDALLAAVAAPPPPVGAVPAEAERRAPPRPAEVWALAQTLDRVVVLLHSRRPAAADALDRRGLVYVFHPGRRRQRAYVADPMLRTLVAGGYPADAYAWGEFRSRAPRREEGDLHEGAPRGGGEADLGEEGLKLICVMK